MKKTYIIFAILLLACGCSKGEKKESIPSASLSDFVDPLFFGYMQTQYDTNDDFIFQSEEIASVTDMDLSKQTYIFNLKGLEKFVALGNLNISGLNLQDKKLKITNPKLTQLVCSNMDLRELNIESLTELEILDCSKNTYMNTLDLSHNKKLRELNCESTSSSSSHIQLDLSDNIDIEKINCKSNYIDNINLTNCKKLQYLDCYSASLKTVNFSDCPALLYLDIGGNPTQSLDLNSCANLKYLDVRSYQLLSLNISNNILLEELFIELKKYYSLDIRNNSNLKRITLEAISKPLDIFVIYITEGQSKPQINSLNPIISYVNILN